jgi:ubiquinone/menaquinone biosynthesis C-methylase UbiE
VAEEHLERFGKPGRSTREDSTRACGTFYTWNVTRFEDSYGAVTARFYDAAYGVSPQLGADVDFYRALARETGGPVLELGCGTGRVLLEIARDGLACTGVDASQAMLDVARSKASRPAPRLIRAAMQEFDLGGERFRLIFSAFRAFQHLYTIEDQLRCLVRVRAHLAPGGRFAFDVFQPRLERLCLDEEPEEEDLRFQHGDEEVVRHVRVSRDRAAQLQRVTMRYERRRGERLVANEETSFRMRWFHRFELEHLMARAGFDDVRIHGDFDHSPVERDSPAFVVVASAAGATASTGASTAGATA